jgi:membrane-bound serine protease (ClpP class)
MKNVITLLIMLGTLGGASVHAQKSPPSKERSSNQDLPLPEVKPLTGALPEGAVVVIPLQGAVSKAQFFFLRRIVKMGEAAKASAYILDMDTPGGELGAGVDILQALLKVDAPTYTYVNPNAGSAGALIALGTKHIWMAPVSAIGAAAPVMGGGQEIPETMNAKIVSYYSGYFRSAAENNGHNPEIAEAFINVDKEVKVGNRVISKKGELLTLSAQEAVEKFEGKPLLADGIAPSVAALVRDAGLTGAVVKAEPSGFERAALYITMLAPLFLLGGIIGTYIEFKSPGFGVPGVIAAICFLLFFAGHYIAGLTGMEVVAFFVLGLILILIELIFIPGIVILALLGSLMMIGSLLWAMVDYYPSAPDWPGLDVLLLPLANLGVALGLSAVAAFFLAQFLPKIPMLRRLVLTTNEPAGGSLQTDALGSPRSSVTAGARGRALSMLRPIGRAEFHGEIVDARAEGDFISPGMPVVALRLEGSEVIVESARE